VLVAYARSALLSVVHDVTGVAAAGFGMYLMLDSRKLLTVICYYASPIHMLHCFVACCTSCRFLLPYVDNSRFVPCLPLTTRQLEGHFKAFKRRAGLLHLRGIFRLQRRTFANSMVAPTVANGDLAGVPGATQVGYLLYWCVCL